jgi:hypothetical protein
MGRRGYRNAVLGDSWHGWVRPHESIPVPVIPFDNPSAAAASFRICSFDSIWTWFGASDARGWTWPRCAIVSALSTAEYVGWTLADAKHDGWTFADAQYARRTHKYGEERERG